MAWICLYGLFPLNHKRKGSGVGVQFSKVRISPMLIGLNTYFYVLIRSV